MALAQVYAQTTVCNGLEGGKNSMKSSNQHQSISALEPGPKSYSAPELRRLTPDVAREMLLLHDEADDPEIKFMLDCIERLRYPKGS